MLVRLDHVSKGNWQPEIRTTTGSTNGAAPESSGPLASVTSLGDGAEDTPRPVATLERSSVPAPLINPGTLSLEEYHMSGDGDRQEDVEVVMIS